MSNTCKTCQRPDVDEINKLIASKKPLRYIVDNFKISQGGIQRHKDNCLKDIWADVIDERRAGLLANVDVIVQRIEQLESEYAGNSTLQSHMVQRRIAAVELEAKLTGAFVNPKDNPDTTANAIAAYQDWARDYPDATYEEQRVWLSKFASQAKVTPDQLAEKVQALPGVQ